MDLLKRIPIKYKGELHNVQLVNFSVDINEVIGLVPPQVKVRNFNGKAIISMVNVELKEMRPDFVPSFGALSYQHIGFRLLVDDSHLNNGKSQGIYFLRSFTNKPGIVWVGTHLSDYKLELAGIRNEYGFELRQSNNYLRYCAHTDEVENMDIELKEMIQVIDRAYSVRKGQLYKTQIQRECWPIEGFRCLSFSTNFFKSAQFLGAFQVKEVIHYKWLPAQPVHAALRGRLALG